MSEQEELKPLWFESDKLRGTLEQLEHFTRFGDLLILLIGESQSGKTTTLKKMQERIIDSDICFINSHPLLSIQEILRRMRTSFNLVLTPDQAEQSIEQMHDYLAASIPEKNHRLVIIDDAEQLGKETLLELLKLVDLQRQKGESLVHFVLAGEEPLLTSLRGIKHKKFPRAAYHRLKISPLQENEFSQFIYHANQDKENLSEDMIKKVLEISGGNIGKALVCLDNLQKGIEPEQVNKAKKKITRKISSKQRSELEQKIDTLYGDLEDDNSWLMPVVIVLGIIAFGAYWYLQYEPIKEHVVVSQPNKPETVIQPNRERLEIEQKLAVSKTSQEQSAALKSNESTKGTNDSQVVTESAEEQQVKADTETILQNSFQSDESTGQAEDGDKTVLLGSKPDNKTINTEEKPSPVPVQQDDTTDRSETSSENNLEKADLAKSKVEVITEAALIDDSSQREVSDVNSGKELVLDKALPQTIIGNQKSNAIAETKPKNGLAPANNGDATEIQTWLSNEFTIQLLVVSEQKSFDRFSAQYPSLEFKWFKSIRKNKPVYFVVYGHFATKQEALAQANQLKQRYSKLSTWVKSVALIHQDILVYSQK